MKQIIVPTDFSENAVHALRYAISFMNNLGGDITLLHTFQISTSGAGRFVALDEMVQQEREEELNGLIAKVKDQLADTVRLNGKVVEGYAVDTIAEQADAHHVNFVVMGTRGASGVKKIFMGSTTSNVIRNTKVPVLAVPDDAGDFSMKHLLLALDASDMPDATVLNPALDLAAKFGAEVSILHINSNDKDDSISPNIQAYFEQMGIKYTYYKLQKSGDASENILDFAKQKNTDLVCVLNRHRSWFSQLFQTSVSQQLAFESNIPLLVLHA